MFSEYNQLECDNRNSQHEIRKLNPHWENSLSYPTNGVCIYTILQACLFLASGILIGLLLVQLQSTHPNPHKSQATAPQSQMQLEEAAEAAPPAASAFAAEEAAPLAA